jgi:hypothetical protein
MSWRRNYVPLLKFATRHVKKFSVGAPIRLPLRIPPLRNYEYIARFKRFIDRSHERTLYIQVYASSFVHN